MCFLSPHNILVRSRKDFACKHESASSLGVALEIKKEISMGGTKF